MSRWDRVADLDAAERLRSVRERLEATVSGLGELEFLRQRQEVLVRTALELREPEAGAERRREVELSYEEKLLEENILLLRKQLNCLRRRDAGLIGQLQELDRQICDLRLDSELPRDQLETDSRPSSGFYELSDGASGSLSNSSNSVFSECFCSAPDADGRLPSTDELASCLECHSLLGGLCDDSSASATVRRSLSAPHPPSLDCISSLASCDSQSKLHWDLVARHGGDVYRYPSPLHAVAVQSPAFLQPRSHGGHSREEGLVKSIEVVADAETFPLSAPPVSQSCSWPAVPLGSLAPSHKQLDSYIYSLLQRRALPVRTSKPRTSISTDPSKSLFRQASLCVRQVSGPGSGSSLVPPTGSESNPSWKPGGASAEEAATSPESKGEEQNVSPHGSSDVTRHPNGSALCHGDGQTNSLQKTNKKGQLPVLAASTAAAAPLRPLGPGATASPRDAKQPCSSSDQEALANGAAVIVPLTTGRSSQSSDGSAAERAAGLGSDGGGRSHIQAQDGKLRSSKTVSVKMSRAAEPSEHKLARRGEKSQHRSSSKKSRLLENGGSAHNKVSKRITGAAPGVSSTKIKRLPASIPEGRVLDRHTTATLNSTRSRHLHGNQHHGRDQLVVVAKPKHKRNDYRRFPYDEALRRAHRHRRKVLRCSAAKTDRPSYLYLGASDSEYSAECASLFHSTIVDSSEDEKSNYTTNCFGDSESSMKEYMEESTATSDTEESGGGGTGGRSRGRNQPGPTEATARGQEVAPAQAKTFVKIKASHNLKKKILRFRSGSLKLMTTV